MCGLDDSNQECVGSPKGYRQRQCIYFSREYHIKSCFLQFSNAMSYVKATVFHFFSRNITLEINLTRSSVWKYFFYCWNYLICTIWNNRPYSNTVLRLSFVFSVLQFTASDCPFGIFKLFLHKWHWSYYSFRR
jgi:hypothetical protein